MNSQKYFTFNAFYFAEREHKSMKIYKELKIFFFWRFF